MFRIVIAVLAVIGLASLFSGEAAGAAAGVGLLVLAPVFFFFKFLFFVMLFGFFFRAMGGRRHARHWGGHWQQRMQDEWDGRRQWTAEGRWDGPRGWGRRPRRQPDEIDERTRRDRFEEMHDLAHAKEEVESWGKYDF